MRKIFALLCAVTTITVCYAQNAIGSVNSGALSGNNLLYTVGEIYVLPANNANEANSGIGGIISKLNLVISGVDEVSEAQNLRVFPNPVQNSLFIEVPNNQPVNRLYVYDISGQLVNTAMVNNGSADLSALRGGTYIISADIEKKQSFKIIKK